MSARSSWRPGRRPLLALIAAAFAPFSLAAQPAAPPPATADQWRAAAREDVEAAYELFRTRHPGMFDPANPGFAARLRQARDRALAFAGRAGDAEGHMRALALFSAGLADGHATAAAIYSGSGRPLWPGFTTAWRGDALRILDPGESRLPRGAALLGCDGRAARDLIRESAFFFYGRPDEAGQWWLSAPLFFDRLPSPYETLPRECSFRAPDGETVTRRLDWRPMPQAVDDARFEAATRRDPIGLSEPRPGLYRINLPTFSPDDEGRAAYAVLFADLDARAAQLAAGRAIVIDLRHNNGGSSLWGEGIAGHLWGEGAVRAAMADYFRRTRIRWLAEPANIAQVREAVARFRAQGQSEVAEELSGVADGMAAARARGARFHVEDFGARLAARAGTARPRRLAPVYVIIDGGCASACLDALDVFTRFPGVKLVGAPTSADSNYLEILRERLPSGRGWVVLPTKIWVRRPRAAGQVYRPDIEVDDLEWTTAALLDRVERDLAR